MIGVETTVSQRICAALSWRKSVSFCRVPKGMVNTLAAETVAGSWIGTLPGEKERRQAEKRDLPLAVMSQEYASHWQPFLCLQSCENDPLDKESLQREKENEHRRDDND